MESVPIWFFAGFIGLAFLWGIGYAIKGRNAGPEGKESPEPSPLRSQRARPPHDLRVVQKSDRALIEWKAPEGPGLLVDHYEIRSASGTLSDHVPASGPLRFVIPRDQFRRGSSQYLEVIAVFVDGARRSATTNFTWFGGASRLP